MGSAPATRATQDRLAAPVTWTTLKPTKTRTSFFAPSVTNRARVTVPDQDPRLAWHANLATAWTQKKAVWTWTSATPSCQTIKTPAARVATVCARPTSFVSTPRAHSLAWPVTVLASLATQTDLTLAPSVPKGTSWTRTTSASAMKRRVKCSRSQTLDTLLTSVCVWQRPSSSSGPRPLPEPLASWLLLTSLCLNTIYRVPPVNLNPSARLICRLLYCLSGDLKNFSWSVIVVFFCILFHWDLEQGHRPQLHNHILLAFH